MAVIISPLTENFGAVVSGMRLARLSDADWTSVHKAFLKYAVLIFPEQHLTPEEQSRFALRIGDIESLVPGHNVPSVPLSNITADGSLAAPGSRLFKVLHGNEGWHTDSTYMPLASKASLLSAQIVPSSGGETEWADMRAAYASLDDNQKKEIDNLSAYHSLYYSQAMAGFSHETGDGYGYHDKGMPLRPLVKVHPETGQKALYTGRHAFGIPGMEDNVSKALLTELIEHACQPPRLYKHNWQPGDIAMWDNRCLLHRARPYDTKESRVMLATRIAGDPNTELAPTFADNLASGFQPTSVNNQGRRG